jgi:hypothetical protein
LSYRMLHYPLDLLRIPEMFVVLIVFFVQMQLRHIIYDNQSRADGSSDEFRKAFVLNTSHTIDSVQRTINVICQTLLQIFRQSSIF